MLVTMESFLRGVDAIAEEKPTYRLGHDGSDGTCDCIGLIIGAIRRAGGEWTGTHGSNWAARNAMDTLLPVTDAGDLQVGQVVYKAAMPGQSGYNLPDRYRDDVDKRDYYHVGVVRSVAPLEIVHCTGPGIVHDSKLGKWNYAGWLRMVSRENDEGEATGMQTAVVTAESGSTVNLRKTPEGALLDRVPVGSKAQVLDTLYGWARVTVAGKTGWMDKRYLQMQEGVEDASGDAGDSSEVDTVTVVLPRSAAEALLSALGGVLGWG
ncbi:MAG: SH3 domain-containing protein [Eubacteriales bacterium]|nr:SH3 domain-containing protein [Eubacteriales bacterium]